jgi:hypothetical protein
MMTATFTEKQRQAIEQGKAHPVKASSQVSTCGSCTTSSRAYVERGQWPSRREGEEQVYSGASLGIGPKPRLHNVPPTRMIAGPVPVRSNAIAVPSVDITFIIARAPDPLADG